jgi:hypothetical protein
MKTDVEGKIIWKSSVECEVESCDLFQIVNDNVVAMLRENGFAVFSVVNIETGDIELTF